MSKITNAPFRPVTFQNVAPPQSAPGLKVNERRPHPDTSTFERARTTGPVALTSPDNADAVRAEMVKKVHAYLTAATTQTPPMSEDALKAGFVASLKGKASLPESTQEALRDLARGAIQVGRARLQAASGDLGMARSYLDQPEPGQQDDEYAGAIFYRNRANRSGELSSAEVAPLAIAIRDVTGQTLGGINPEQVALNTEAADVLKQAGTFKDYLESKNMVMSQSQMIQVPANDLVEKYAALEKALSLPLVDPNRDAAVSDAVKALKSDMAQLGSVETLEERRKSAIEGLDKLGALIASIPTPPTRLVGNAMKQTSASLQLASGDITRDEYALKTVANIVDVAGGNLGDKLTGAVKVLAEVGADFIKTLSDELSKVPPGANSEERQRGQIKAVANAAYTSAVNQLRNKLGGEVPERVLAGIARTFVSGLSSMAAEGGWDVRTNPKYTPEERVGRVKDMLWKAAGEALKAQAEFWKQ